MGGTLLLLAACAPKFTPQQEWVMQRERERDPQPK